jgi:hypothetical protein
MSKSASLLDRTYVATPCTADWGRMEGDERKRFCGQCNLHVYNVSAMSRGEAEALIARTEGRLCLRLYRRADGTAITRDCPVGLRAVRRHVSRAAGAAFAAVLSFLSVPVAARAHVSQGQAATAQLKIERTQSTSADSLLKLEGTVFDTHGALIVGARVTLVRDGEEGERALVTNEAGAFSFGSLGPGSYTLVVSSPGFVTFTKKSLPVTPGEDVSLGATLEVGAVGEVITVTQGDVAAPAPPPASD